MEPIILKCTNCGGELEFDRSMSFGFCKYCGTKVMIPKPESEHQSGIISTETKFYLLVYFHGEQTQHAIKDEVSISVNYRNNAGSMDTNPLGIEIRTNGVPIPNKIRLPVSVGIGTMQIAGVGSNLTLTKERKLHVAVNGSELETNSIPLGYGDLVSVGKVILRIQPMKT